MRSMLFVPGDSEKKLNKGLASGADCLLIDLEDSVALDNKNEARKITAAFLRQAVSLSERPKLYVRVNAFDTGLTGADLDTIMPERPDGIMLPKSLSGADVTRLDAQLAVAEAENDLIDGKTRIIAIATETAGSLFTMHTYTGASRRLEGMAWGAEDLSADIGASTNRAPDGSYTEPFRFARMLCLFGASAATVTPIDGVYTNFRDMDGLRAECEEAERDGFTAKMAIHPAQVAVINDVFTPSPEAIAHARAIENAFREAGDGVGVVGLNGEMIDRPHLVRARKILARADLASA